MAKDYKHPKPPRPSKTTPADIMRTGKSPGGSFVRKPKK